MLWQLYFWLFALAMVGTTITRAVLYFIKPGSVSIYDVAESLPCLACVVAVYGFVYGVLLGSKLVWIALACIVPVAYVISIRSAKTRAAFEQIGRSKALLAFGAAFLFTLPAYVAVVIYATRFA